MEITFTTQVNFNRLELKKVGEVLIVNGVEYDFSLLEEGATLPTQAIMNCWIYDEVKRESGLVRIKAILPVLDPGDMQPDIVVNLDDGEVDLREVLDRRFNDRL